MSTCRAFIAIHIHPTATLNRLIDLLSDFGKAVRPVNHEQLHLTLRFLGTTERAQLPDIQKRIEAVAANAEPFDITLAGLGAFPNLRRPSVIWAGIRNPQPLISIVDALNPPIDELGFKHEQRAYNPHLTLARVKFKPPGELRQVVEANDQLVLGQQRVTSIDLMLSELKPTGAVYETFSSAVLNKR